MNVVISDLQLGTPTVCLSGPEPCLSRASLSCHAWSCLKSPERHTQSNAHYDSASAAGLTSYTYIRPILGSEGLSLDPVRSTDSHGLLALLPWRTRSPINTNLSQYPPTKKLSDPPLERLLPIIMKLPSLRNEKGYWPAIRAVASLCQQDDLGIDHRPLTGLPR